MSENEQSGEPRREHETDVRPPPTKPEPREPPETARKPAPGIEHEPEPDGENLIPTKDRPGTL
jgi:hypothetical protein